MNELYLEHHGILGQKWGVRRYQNPDGSVTTAGAKRYYGEGSITKDGKYRASNGTVIAKSKNASVDAMRRFSVTPVGRALSASGRGAMSKATGRSKESIKAQETREREALKEYYKNGGDKMFDVETTKEKKGLSDKQKTAIKVGVAAAGVALAAYGGYKLSKYVKSEAYKKITNEGKQAIDNYKKQSESLWNAYEKEISKTKDIGEIKALKTKRANEIININRQISNTSTNAVDKAYDVSKSFKKSFDTVYGKDKHKKSDDMLKSMGIKIIELNDSKPVDNDAIMKSLEKLSEAANKSTAGATKINLDDLDEFNKMMLDKNKKFKF